MAKSKERFRTPPVRGTHFIFSSLQQRRTIGDTVAWGEGKNAEILFSVGDVLGGYPVWSNFFIRFIQALEEIFTCPGLQQKPSQAESVEGEQQKLKTIF